MPDFVFSLPYNDDPETLRELFALQGTGGNTISEVYLSGPQEYSGSGRITQPLELGKFTEIVDTIHRYGARANLVLNPTCQGAEWYSAEKISSILNFVEKMHRDHGVSAVTIANPVYIRLVKQHLPALEVGASVLCDIDSVQKAEIVREYGADVITPEASINRDLELLAAIKAATGARIKIMVNEGCLYRCVFRKFHFNYVSHWSKELQHSKMAGKDFFAHCTGVTLKDPSLIFKSGWIRPEDLARYRAITALFKVVGRARPRIPVVRAARAYLSEHYAGNLFDIICSSLNAFGLTYGAYVDNASLGASGFFDTVSGCGMRCEGCGYCRELAGRLLKLNVVTREKLEDLGRAELADRLDAAGRLPRFGQAAF